MKRVSWIVILALVSCVEKPPARPQKPFPLQTPPRIEVTVEPEGFVAWTIRVKNGRDVPIRLLWDESTFIDGAGRGYNRLLRGHTRVIDDAKAQTATIIGPDSYVVEWCVPEDLKDVKADSMRDRHGDRDYSGLEPVRKGVGRIMLVFETPTGPETWEEALSFDGSPPPPPRQPTAAPRAGPTPAAAPQSAERLAPEAGGEP